MSYWVGAFFKRVDHFTGYNWIEFLDVGVRPAVRKFAQRCLKYGLKSVNWINRKGRSKKHTY